MKSCWIRNSGGRISLELRDVPEPVPGKGEVLLRVHAAGLNRGEFISHNKADSIQAGGREAAGTVVAVGEGVTGIRIGDRIMGRARGAFAEYTRIEAHQAMPVPERLQWTQAAAVPLAFLVTYDMLYPYGKLKPAEWLLITGVSSGVGVASLQTAKAIGAQVIGTSGSAEKLEALKMRGLDHGIVTRVADFAAQARALAGGGGVDVIVNNVGGSVFEECVRALAHRGRLATVGTLDGVDKAEIDIGAMHARRLELFGVSNGHTTPAERAQSVTGFKRDVLPAFADGRIAPAIDRVFGFDELPAAHAHMQANAHVGKIVVSVV